MSKLVGRGWRARTTLALLLALAPLAPAAAEPSAAPETSWGIRPADSDQGSSRDNFRYEATPGETIEDALVVTNRGTAPLELGVYGADGELRDGQVELAAADVAPEALGAWLDVEPRLELAPGQSVEVPFTLTVPASTAPGAHAGGLVTSSLVAADAAVAVDRRLAASIVVIVVPGGASPAAPGASSSDGATPSSDGASPSPLALALLGLLGLLVVAAGVWGFVLRGRATR